MSGRPTDPNTRRLRRFVLLVIFAVTLPSLLMSGFGLIAINNEQDAAYRRVKKLYQPVVVKLAHWLEQRLLKTIELAESPLSKMAGWARGDIPAPKLEVARLLEQRTSLVNFFVVGPDGQMLFPGEQKPRTSFGGYLPELFSHGLKTEFEDDDPASAVAIYQALLGEMGGKSARCLAMRSVPMGLSPHTQEVPKECLDEGGEGDRNIRCLVRNALARSLDRAGQKPAAIAEWGRLADTCPAFVESSGYNLALAARLRRLQLMLPERLAEARLEAAALAAALRDPLVPASRDQVLFVARRAAQVLRLYPGRHLASYLGVFESISMVDELHRALPDLSKSLEQGSVLHSVDGRLGRRMLVVRKGADGTMAGFEIAPSMLEPVLREFLDKLDLGLDAVARIRPPTAPLPSDASGLLAGSVVLTDGQFAWRLDLTLSDDRGLKELTHSRAQLYLWILVLLVLVLVIGIVGTVWVMVRETRLSRLKTDFVSNVSHELRTPLTSIRLFSETLSLGRARDEEEQQEFLQIIAKESERLSRLVERILDFSRMEANRKAYSLQPADVGELVKSATTACRSWVDARECKLVLRLPDDLPEVPVDRDAMVEVLINLLSNALKYGAAGERVIVAARAVDGWLELSITDFGVGIARVEQTRIFDKFYRVETPLTSEVSGSGLGLSLVRYIIEGHGGEVLVDSAPGKGSTFTVRLPLAT